MKRILSITLVASLVLSAFAGPTGDLVTKGLARGMDNMVAAPAEVFHATVLDCSEYSLVGLITGPVKGTIFSLCRFFGGLADFATIGLIPDESSPYRTLMVVPIYLQREVAASQPAAFPAPQK